MKDPRTEMTNCDICANDVFRNSWRQSGVEQLAFQPPPRNGNQTSTSAPHVPASADQEALIRSITDRVMEVLKSK